jgi:hypothetical protein
MKKPLELPVFSALLGIAIGILLCALFIPDQLLMHLTWKAIIIICVFTLAGAVTGALYVYDVQRRNKSLRRFVSMKGGHIGPSQ